MTKFLKNYGLKTIFKLGDFKYQCIWNNFQGNRLFFTNYFQIQLSAKQLIAQHLFPHQKTGIELARNNFGIVKLKKLGLNMARYPAEYQILKFQYHTI